MTDKPCRIASVIGAGLIGGSIAARLSAEGWNCSISDVSSLAQDRAIELGLASSVGIDPQAELVVVATPVDEVVPQIKVALEQTSAVVMDVGSTKSSICDEVTDPRFVGTHPMAGSERAGIEAANSELFKSAAWVVCPNEVNESSVEYVRNVIGLLGGDCVVLTPKAHDGIVALVSHVPHLVAAALVRLATVEADGQAVLLRLAAGGFRDMTRVAAGDPHMWPSVCFTNADFIASGLDNLIAELSDLKLAIANRSGDRLFEYLQASMEARRNLPTQISPKIALSELKIAVTDKPGELAKITKIAADGSVNIFNIEITHVADDTKGRLALLVERDDSQGLVEALIDQGYQPTVTEIIR